jgi:hypothetical protein
MEKLAAAWIALNSRPSPMDLNVDDPNLWAHERLWQMSRSNPDDCWCAILYIMERAQNDYILGSLAAGPLENFLGYHGEEFIVQVERRAASDTIFRKLLSGVWQNNISDNVWYRIRAAVAGLG